MSDALSAFSAAYPFPLDDYQREACAHLEAGAGVLVAAPTGAGKTVVGEFAVYLARQQGRTCFYTTPIKALSNQKFHDLVERYGPENVGLLTGDTSINGDAPIVVMTTEVLRNMIYVGSSTLHNLGYVVLDEVHYLADRFRGAVWEEVIIGLAESVQVVALSATVSNAEEFGEWLDEVRGGVEIVVSERRPVPLFQHVMVGNRLVDLFAGFAPTARVLPGDHRADVNPELLRVAKDESRNVRDDSRRPRGRSGKGKRTSAYGSGGYGGAAHGRFADRGPRLTPSRAQMVEALERASLLPAIVFVFSRQGCDGAVRQVVGSGVRLTHGHERAALAEIAGRHTAGLSAPDLDALEYDRFHEALLRGVAAHHAGLLPAFKAIVEEAFVRGLLKVVFATETLALGINMPARTVVLEKLVKYNGETHADITPGEYTQLTGRAGRRGIDVEGHAVVLWQPGLDPRAVAGLASRRTYPPRSSFAPTYNMAVNLVGSVGRERARSLLEQSFAQFQTDRSVVGMARSMQRNTDEVAELLAKAACDRGDFAEYARLREEVGRLEARAARLRKADRRAEALETMLDWVPGDIIEIPAGRNAGWAVVLDPGTRGRARHDPHPLVLTEARQVVRLTTADVPLPAPPAGRLRTTNKFVPRGAASPPNLAGAVRAGVAELEPPEVPVVAMDATLAAEIDQLRRELRDHPCHGCPDRETHARFAERAMRLERDSAEATRKAEARTNTIAKQFDRICLVLSSLSYLDDEGETITDAGRMLARIYAELDLVAAECVRQGVFDGLSAPQLAAVLSTLVFESRPSDAGRPVRMPDAASERAQSRLRSVWRDVGLVERDHRVERGRSPDIGFAELAFAWAAGRPLADVLGDTGMPAGDFVRWARQVIDFAGQLAQAVGPGDLRRTCREIIHAMQRGVVSVDPDED